MRNKRSFLSPGVTSETIEDVSILFCGVFVTVSVMASTLGYSRLSEIFLGISGLFVFSGILSMIIKRLRRKYSPE